MEIKNKMEIWERERRKPAKLIPIAPAMISIMICLERIVDKKIENFHYFSAKVGLNASDKPKCEAWHQLCRDENEHQLSLGNDQ